MVIVKRMAEMSGARRTMQCVLGAACLIAAAVSGAAAAAQDSNEAAKAAARAVGSAGLADARALATDASQPSKVPGFVGTAVPQTGHSATELAATAREALADADDDGGAVGAFVVQGALARPDADVSATDPDVQRGAAIEASPNAPGWRAAGLASGTVQACTADLSDAGSAGRCGGVRYCVGAGCDGVDAQANTAFVPAATRLNMVIEMGGSEFDRTSMRIFSGALQACTIRLLGAQNCCTDSGVLVEAGILGCSAGEVELAEARAAGVTHYLGEYCAKRIFGICQRRDRAWCVFTSELGRILHEQARPQLGRNWNDCDGFTVAEIERIDFDRVDLSQFTATLLDESRAPGVSLPDAGATGTLMRDRIDDYYERND